MKAAAGQGSSPRKKPRKSIQKCDRRGDWPAGVLDASVATKGMPILGAFFAAKVGSHHIICRRRYGFVPFAPPGLPDPFPMRCGILITFTPEAVNVSPLDEPCTRIMSPVLISASVIGFRCSRKSVFSFTTKECGA